MPTDASVNFGWWVRWKRIEKGFPKASAFAAKIGIGGRRLIDIEKRKPLPDLPDGTLGAIAAVLGYSGVDALNAAWKSQPVREPRFKDTTARSARIVITGSMADELTDIAAQHGTTPLALIEPAIRVVITRLSGSLPPEEPTGEQPPGVAGSVVPLKAGRKTAAGKSPRKAPSAPART